MTRHPALVPAINRPHETAEFLHGRFLGAPFATGDALAAGVSWNQLRAAVRAGGLVRLRHGVLVPAEVVRACTAPRSRHLLDVRGLLVVVGRATTGGRGATGQPSVPPQVGQAHPAPAGGEPRVLMSHASAAAVLGLPHPSLFPVGRWPVEVTGPAWNGPSLCGWTRYLGAVPEGSVVTVDGIRCTDAVRTAADVARTRALPDALVVVDAVLRRIVLQAQRDGRTADRDTVNDPVLRGAAAARLRAVAVDLVGWPDVEATRRVLALGDPAAENAFESASRGHLLRAGLPRPECGMPVRVDDGTVYWADLAWPERGVIGEADGRGKYTGLQVVYAEKRRQDALQRAGWKVVRWTYDELARTPGMVVDRVAASLGRRSAAA